MPNPNLDLSLGSPVLPEQVKRVRTDHRGHVSLHVDTETHDLDFLGAIAEAVAEHAEMVDALKRYAEVQAQIDTAEINDDRALARSLRDNEAADALADVTSWMEREPGEGLIATLRPQAADALVGALAGEAVSA